MRGCRAASRPAYELAIAGTNLLDTDYQEIAGVRMPGAAVMVELKVGPR